MAALITALAAGLGATALPAQAAVSSASINDLTATLNLDGADDNVTVSVVGGLLVHGQTTGGLSSGSDWDSAAPNNQTVPADGTNVVVVNGGAGNDRLVGAKGRDEMNGGEGNDTLVWNNGDNSDVIYGDDGNDTTEVN